MDYIRISQAHFHELRALQTGYKQEIGEECPDDGDFRSLFDAITDGRILFFGCLDEGRLIGCCSVTPAYSTFDYQTGGVFEDFFILPEYRHQGIARKLVQYAYRESGVSSLTVGCADCDLAMYKALGFSIPLGNLLAFKR